MKLKLVSHGRLSRARREVPYRRPTMAVCIEQKIKREDLYNAIERTQAFMHKRTPPDEVMALIRERFPAPLFFIESGRIALENAGLNRLDAFYYSMIPSLTRTTLSQQWGAHPSLDCLARASAYVQTLYVGVHIECFYLIMLDRRGQLIRAALMQKGDHDRAPFYLRPLLRLALAEKARFIVLAHNHPSGTRQPSREDVRCTLQALNAFIALDIPLLDHLIEARDTVVSMRANAVFPEQLWTTVKPNSRIVRGWLDPPAKKKKSAGKKRGGTKK